MTAARSDQSGVGVVVKNSLSSSDMDGRSEPVPGPVEIEELGRGYWEFVARRSLGIFRATEGEEGRIRIIVRGTSLDLLRFGPPRYESREDGASVTWPIAGGALTLPEGQGRGFLRFTVTRAEGDANTTTLRAAMEVRGFYPSLRGRGTLAPAGALFYSLTQRVFHRAMTRAYLRSLGRTATLSPRHRVQATG